jgi:hypothetical protein
MEASSPPYEAPASAPAPAKLAPLSLALLQAVASHTAAGATPSARVQDFMLSLREGSRATQVPRDLAARGDWNCPTVVSRSVTGKSRTP